MIADALSLPPAWAVGLELALLLVVPLWVGVVYLHKAKVPMLVFVTGMFFFALTQLAFLMTMLLLAPALKPYMVASAQPLWLAALVTLMMAAVQEGIRFVAFQRVPGMKEQRTLQGAAAYGLGMGACGAILLGVSILKDLAVLAVNPQAVPRGVIEGFAAVPWLAFPLEGLDQVLGMAVQVALSVLVMRAVQGAGRQWWMGAMVLAWAVFLLPFAVGMVNHNFWGAFVTRYIAAPVAAVIVWKTAPALWQRRAMA